MNRLNESQTFTKLPNVELSPCVWMQAGVVDYKLCDRDYECEHCPFDRAFHPHSTQQFQFDAQRSDRWTDVRGFRVPRSIFFYPQHTWVQIEDDGVVRIGLDDFGQRMIGRAYSVSLPPPGTRLQTGATCVTLTHQYGCSSIGSPVSGRVQDANFSLDQRPSLLNQSPYDEGWLMRIAPDDLNADLKRLMYGERVCEWLNTEIDKLLLVIADQAETSTITMNDGGRLTREFMSELTGSRRKQIIDSFFPPVLDRPAESNKPIKFPKRR